MKGTILNVTASEILIRCSEGNKFTAAFTNVKSTDVKPKVGDDVDFEVSEGQAIEVYILRSASAVENLTQNATAKAASAINAVKSQMTEENKEKVRHMAANASETAQKLGGELKGKAGELLSNIQANGVGSAINPSSFNQLQNKFALFALAFLLLFSFTNIGKFEDYAKFSYYDMTETYIVAFFLVGCMVIAALGLNTIIYRVALGITLFVMLLPLSDLYDFAKEGAQLGRDLGIRMRAPSFSKIFSNFTTGFIWFFIAGFVMTVATLLPGLYKAKQPQQLKSGHDEIHP
jgi:hypothetical protein